MGIGHEPRIRELERRFELMGDDLRTLRRQTTVVAQGVRDYWIDGIGLSPASPAPCVTIVKGKVAGCRLPAVALAGSTIQILGHVTGHDYGTYTLATGNYELGLYLQDGDTSVDFYTQGPTARWATSAAQSRSLSACLTNTLTDLTTTTASGFYCIPSLCNFPLPATLRVIDSRLGNTTVTHGISPSDDWTSATGVLPFYRFQQAPPGTFGSWSVTTSGGGFSANFVSAPTCPDAAGAVFDVTYTVTGTPPGSPYSVGDTIRFVE